MKSLKMRHRIMRAVETTIMMPENIKRTATQIILCANFIHKSLNGALLPTTSMNKIRKLSLRKFIKIFGRIHRTEVHFMIKCIFMTKTPGKKLEISVTILSHNWKKLINKEKADMDYLYSKIFIQLILMKGQCNHSKRDLLM